MTSLQQAFTHHAFDPQNEYDPNSLAVDAARTFILSQITPLGGSERLNVRAALGRVLAENLIAPCNVPAHDNSAMDGYGFRHADLAADSETRLPVTGTVLAGPAYSGMLPAQAALRIMTGAAIPSGVDTVVPQEATRIEKEADTPFVVIPPKQRQGQHIRRAGEDLAAGSAALSKGKLIRPAELGLMASLGFAEVPVQRKPRVAFFSTGDELVSVGQLLKAGEVYDSNRYTLYGMITRLGCEVIDLGVIRDDAVALETAFRQAAETADVIITSGGVSVGEADFVKTLMARLGEVLFWKIAMKPGRPLAFGRLAAPAGQQSGNAPRAPWLFGLPGNPVAVMATFYQFVRPALLKLMGCDPIPAIPTFKARLTEPARKNRGRTEFQRGVLFYEENNREWCVRALPDQGSGILRSMSEANCFIVLPPDTNEFAAGTMVDVQAFEGIVS